MPNSFAGVLKIVVPALALGLAGGYGLGRREVAPAPAQALGAEVALPWEGTLAPLMESALVEEKSAVRTRKLRRLALALQPGDHAAFLQRISREGDAVAFYALYDDVLSEWATLDPQAAMAYASGLAGVAGASARNTVLLAWAEVDEGAAALWIEALPPSEERRGARQALLEAIGRKDLRRFVSLLLEAKDQRMDGELLNYSVWSRWIAKDPRAAVEAAMALPPGALRNQALQGISSSWALKDPEAAISWITLLLPGSERDLAASNLVFQLGMQNPKRALQLIMEGFTAPGSRNENIERGAALWARSDPTAAMAWVEALPSGEARQRALDGAFPMWAKHEPQAALAYLLQQPEGAHRAALMSGAVQAWVENDFEGGFRWLQENSTHTSPEMLRKMVGSVAVRYPEQAMRLTRFLAPEDHATLRSVVERWAHAQPDQAAAHLRALPEGPERERFLEGYIGGLAESDPESAAKAALTLPPGSRQESAMRRVAAEWGGTDPASALQWATALPEGTARDGAIASVVQQWARSDQHAAAAFVNKLPLGGTRDRAARQFASAIVHEDPEGAAIWATSIGDAKQRESSLASILRTWKESNAAAATAWVQASTMPDDWKQKALDAK